MIKPAQHDEHRRLKDAADGSLQDFKDQIGKVRSSVKRKTIAKTIHQHPIMAVSMAAAGGCIASRVLGLRAVRLVALVTAQSIARQAVGAVADHDSP